MPASFQISSLEDKEFTALFNLTDPELEKIGATRMIVDSCPGFPCRVSLEDAAIGEEVILLPYQHHKTRSPYQSVGPIFVRKLAKTARLGINEIPVMLTHRLLSLRGYNEEGIMKEAAVTEGNALQEALHTIFNNEEVTYVQIHNAKPGCYNCTAARITG